MEHQSNNPGRPILPLVLVIAGLLLIAGAILWGSNFTQAPPAESPAPSATVNRQNTSVEIPRLALVEAKQAFDQKTAVFVDVRDAQSYANGHIPGAISIPLLDLGSRLKELKAGDWIITYCT